MECPADHRQWRGNYFLARGGVHLTSDVATDFRVWGRIHDPKPTYPQHFVSPRFSATWCCKHTDVNNFWDLQQEKTKFLRVSTHSVIKSAGVATIRPPSATPLHLIFFVSACRSILAIAPLINKGSVGEYREIETFIGRVNNGDVRLIPASRRWAQNRPRQGFCWA